MRCGHEQTIEVLRAEITRLETERADALTVLRDCVRCITEVPRCEMDSAAWSALAERARAVIAYHDEERV